MGRSLTDQGGNKIPRFGAAGIKKALSNLVDGYAMVHCEESECYIAVYGQDIVVTSWESEDGEVQETEFENHDKAIKLFIKLCKRDPLYEGP